MTKPREKTSKELIFKTWGGGIICKDEYFYIGFWILVSGNTKGNWEFPKKKCLLNETG